MQLPRYSLAFALLAAITCLSVSLPAWSADKKQYKEAGVTRNRIVMQISDEDTRKWYGVLSNIRNIQNELGVGNVKIVVVAYGEGLGMVTLESPVGGEITDAMKTGVEFVACENTMKGKHLTKDDMLPELSYAPAAIVRIMELQQQGYAYIKP